MADYSVFSSGPRKGKCKLLRDHYIRYAVEGLRLKVVEVGKKTTKIAWPDGRFLFIGMAGSVRRGSCKTKSMDIAKGFDVRVKEWEAKNGLDQYER